MWNLFGQTPQDHARQVEGKGMGSGHDTCFLQVVEPRGENPHHDDDEEGPGEAKGPGEVEPEQVLRDQPRQCNRDEDAEESGGSLTQRRRLLRCMRPSRGPHEQCGLLPLQPHRGRAQCDDSEQRSVKGPVRGGLELTAEVLRCPCPSRRSSR